MQMRLERQPSPAMIEFYLRRTRAHIALVAQNLEKVARHPDYQPFSTELRERALRHDASKFEEPERTPKIWAAESTRSHEVAESFEYPPDMEARIDAAEQYHLAVNPHHPEFHARPEAMCSVDVIEMVCDWAAIARARGECDGSARCWAEKCVGHRYRFTDEQRDLIMRIIQILECR